MRKLFFILLLAITASCAGLDGRSRECTPPDWVNNPHGDDGWHLYEIGSATGLSSSEEARSVAYKNAIGLLAMRIETKVRVGDHDVNLFTRQVIRGVERMPGSLKECSDDRGYSCWMLVRYPRKEYERIYQDTKARRELESKLGKARAYIANGQFEKAKEVLLQILARYVTTHPVKFKIDKVHLLLGDVYVKQSKYAAARFQYQAVLSHQDTSQVNREYANRKLRKLDNLFPAPRMLVPRERWEGGPVAVLAYIRYINGSQGKVSKSKTADYLLSILKKECMQADLPCFDISKEVSVKDLEDSITEYILVPPLLDKAAAKNAKIILGILIDVDRSKSAESKIVTDNRNISNWDTSIRFCVGRVRDGKILYSDDFIHYANKGERQLLKAVASILLDPRDNKYLIPNCPVLNAPET